jgi:hypothetical protein
LWYVGLDSAREELAARLEEMATSTAIAGLLDVGRMRDAVANWPKTGLEEPDVERLYRFALLRAIAVARFVTKATGESG